MSLSSQIKVPAQVKGAVGGGSADIPGADTADAGQVPTSDGVGGFTWEDQAGGTPTTDAGHLTSGTLAAARLPGVLADVDTQIKLRNAAGAQAAATGTPDGSKYLRDDNSWQAVSATDSTKLPLAGYPSGSAAMTGALAFTGTQSNAGASITNAYRNAAGTLILNVPAGESLAVTENGSTAKGVSILPSNGAVFYGSQTSYGAAQASFYRDSGGNLNSNVATGATHIARVNGARVGGFPLVPGDMPAKNRLDVKLASQNATSSSPTLTYGTPTTNDCFTYSAGVWTCTVAGDYLLEAAMFASFNEISQLAFRKNGSGYGAGAGVPINYTASCLTVMSLTVGQTFEVAGYCQATRALDNTNYFNSFLRATRLN